MFKVKKLKELAKERGLKGYSKLRKEELINLLNIKRSVKRSTKRSVKRRSVSKKDTDYKRLVEEILNVCSKINIGFSKEGDGRITSAIKEKEYLSRLETGLKLNNPDIEIIIPKERFWYDIKINDIPINLKLTSGGTDNVFNKVAILYTITGEEVDRKSMNFNKWFSLILDYKKKETRDYLTEYHYLVVNKNSGKVILKSILDIDTFKSNPCNILQINWNNEFKKSSTTTDFNSKINQLLKTVQKSVRQAIEGMNNFSNADLDLYF